MGLTVVPKPLDFVQPHRTPVSCLAYALLGGSGTNSASGQLRYGLQIGSHWHTLTLARSTPISSAN